MQAETANATLEAAGAATALAMEHRVHTGHARASVSLSEREVASGEVCSHATDVLMDLPLQQARIRCSAMHGVRRVAVCPLLCSISTDHTQHLLTRRAQ